MVFCPLGRLINRESPFRTSLGVKPWLLGDGSFLIVMGQRADALYVCGFPLLTSDRTQINTLALGVRLPTMHGFRELLKREG